MGQYLEGDVWSMRSFLKMVYSRTCAYADEDDLVEAEGDGRSKVLQKVSWDEVRGTNGGYGHDRHRCP